MMALMAATSKSTGRTKVSKEKKEMTTFAQAMPNCGIWIEDEHVWDPDEVDEGDLAGAD